MYKSFLTDCPDGKISKEKFTSKSQDKEIQNLLYNSYGAQTELNFINFARTLHQLSSDSAYDGKMDILFKYVENPNKKGFTDVASITKFFDLLLKSFTRDEIETLPQEYQTSESLVKKFLLNFHIDKKELSKEDFILNLKIYGFSGK